MNLGIYRGVAAMEAAEKRLDAIAGNLANMGVTAYKRKGTATHAFEVALRSGTTDSLRTRETTDFTQGILDPTGRNLDLALNGSGYFAVESPDGETYTRSGRMFLNEDGVLQTIEGFPVAWQGARGNIESTGAPVTVDPEGNVFQGGVRRGQIRIVDFEDSNALDVDNLGYYRAGRGAVLTPHQAMVEQGFLERSNVNAVDELVAMISVQRNYESASRLLSAINQSYRRLASPRG